ncbi:Ig-like domain-containing protein, partial [Pseudomonas sp. NW5]|uniref:Ig-like domain-containing protein n=1 Tax=Pseudomonas sp. NW5 TaxID=2934934 RepID=UPI002021C0F6
MALNTETFLLPGWNEAYYLSNNPDVAAVVARGELTSGLQHFELFGVRENRPFAGFNEAEYLRLNADVAAAVEAGELASGLAHYLQFGQAEGRNYGFANQYADFDEQAYLDANPDVAAAVISGDVASGLEHYALFGKAEGRAAFIDASKYAGFDAQAYLVAYPDVAAAVQAGDLQSALQHFVLFGAAEGRVQESFFAAEPAPNNAPVAEAATAAVAEDAALLEGQLVATDVDTGAELTFALVGEAVAGLTINADGSYTFDAANAAYQSL